MIFNSFEFLWLFPIIWAVYWIIQYTAKYKLNYSKIGNFILLLFSYGLYIRWKPEYALVLLWVTVISYFVARLFKLDDYKKSRFIFILGVILVLLPLLFFKYWNFIGEAVSLLVGRIVGCDRRIVPGLNYALPIGLSFYTFQALGYLSDVYHKRIEAEKDWWDYMLFIAFFPQILSGPISRAKDLLPQIKSNREADPSQFIKGMRLLLWGMFLKVVVADRIGIYVDTVLNNYQHYTDYSVLLGVFLYSFQIYGDFAGYSYMAIGVGNLMGFRLVNNFERPYWSQSISEFWHRWHISLSTWLRDYIYIPLGGSKCSRIRNYFNILVTFLVSGIWHGANWTFILWGLFHGIIQVMEKALGLHKKKDIGLKKMLKVIITFCIISFLWVFFRMPSLPDALSVLDVCFHGWQGGISSMTKTMGLFLVLSISIVMIKKIAEEFHFRWAERAWNCSVIRMLIYLFLISIILTCGVFDTSQFIYVSF